MYLSLQIHSELKNGPGGMYEKVPCKSGTGNESQQYHRLLQKKGKPRGPGLGAGSGSVGGGGGGGGGGGAGGGGVFAKNGEQFQVCQKTLGVAPSNLALLRDV